MRYPLPSFNTDAIQGFWQGEMDFMTVNNNTVIASTANSVFDPGNLQMTADAATIASIYDNIDGSAPMPPNNGQYTSTHDVDLLLE